MYSVNLHHRTNLHYDYDIYIYGSGYDAQQSYCCAFSCSLYKKVED